MKKFFTFMAAALFTATASAQWVVVENFDSENVEERVRLFNVNGTKYNRPPKGEFKIVAGPTSITSNRGNVVEVNCTDEETIVEVDVTLPDGTTLSDYSDIAFDLYYTAVSGDYGDTQCYKRVYVIAGEQNIYVEENYFNILADQNITKGNWGTFSTAIPSNNVSSSFPLRLGILGDKKEPLTYYIDNIRLKEKEAPGTTHNGEIVDGGLLMVEDFEALPLQSSVGMFNYLDYPEEGTASIVENPDVPGNKAASFVGGDFNTVLELDVTLPEKKVLSDYSDVVFDLYVKGRDVGNQDYLHKKMLVWAEEFVIHQDEGENNYPKTADPDIWTKKTYPIPTEGNNIGNAFRLRIGILADDADYLIDNVRLKPTTATGITDVQAGAETVVVVDGGVMINAGAKAAYAVYDISGRAVSQGVADGSKTVTLQRGVYVVRVNGKAVKVLVR